MKKISNFSPEAAFYALPKALIFKVVPILSPSTVKVFLALVYHTDPFNRIKYPEKITYSNIMKITGIKKIDTIRKAFHELVSHRVIGGFSPGFGSECTKFYFTYDIDHYTSCESCLSVEEVESYYRTITQKTTVETSYNDEDYSEEFCENDTILSQSNSDPYICQSSPSPQILAVGESENWHSCNTILAKLINSHSTSHANSNFSYASNSPNDAIDKNLVALAKQSLEFHRAFNDFCIKDTTRYREYTFFWVLYHASINKLALDEIIESLKISCDKGKQGQMSYLIGIFKNKFKDKHIGIAAVGKNKFFSVMEYLKERMYISWHTFEKVEVIDNAIKFVFKDKKQYSDEQYINYCKAITDETNKRFRLNLECVIAA